MKNTWYEFQKMKVNETINPLGSIHFGYGYLLAFALLISLQCAPKDGSPQSIAKDGSPQSIAIDGSAQTSILSSLHVGLPLDSAKILTEGAGWVCDTFPKNPAGPSSLLFLKVHIPNVDIPFVAVLNFKSGKLFSFFLNEDSTLVVAQNPLPARSLDKYRHFESVLERIFGHPSHSGTNIIPSSQTGLPTDTTYGTMWITPSTKGTSTLQYDELYDRLTFVTFGYRTMK
jgi:hypothetical protein